ncbi:protein PNS1 isoform X3 [Cajanus cajan]|uniref:protein PNS1 isoform X3 n=1 Tax=Cajanus cajan TaxID=3821 RepID=UPI00098DA9F6|nr:protein PNS1 isoform X3 [Cajanus cajan]
MTNLNNFNVIKVTDEEKIQVQQEWISSTNPIKAQDSSSSFPNATLAGEGFKILFYLNLLLLAALVISLTLYGLVYAFRSHHFHPKQWYPPLLIATLCGGIVGFKWQWITARNPTKAIRAAFCLSPLLSCAMGVMFVYIGSAPSLAVGARAIENRTMLTALLILVILLSLGWTMQFLKNVLQVTISRVKYMHLFGGEIMDTRVALHDTVKYQTGSVSLGSILVPFISLFRGFARSTSLIGGDNGEVMFSCVSCYMGIASLLVTRGNRWGFVHVGVYTKGFVQASSDTWDIFNRAGLEQLIDLDLTGSFCFLSGMAGGAMCSLVSGIWSIVIHKSYATEISIYAFLIGYFMFRLAMSWPQACVSAYYVAYAENPQSTQFDCTIPVRLEQLQIYQA